jgi:hypothetical protein
LRAEPFVRFRTSSAFKKYRQLLGSLNTPSVWPFPHRPKHSFLNFDSK